MKPTLSPIAPRVPKQLSAWDKDVDTELDIQNVLVSDRNLAEVGELHADECRLEKCSFAGAQLIKLEMTDTICKRLESAGIRPHKASFLRVELSDCRFTGSDFPEASFEDCAFRNVKFDEAGFRFAHFKRVRFEDCILRNADFTNASFAHVTFVNCDIESANFLSATCSNVDMTTQDLYDAKGILGLKGSTISSLQLVQMAPLLATELGFYVKD